MERTEKDHTLFEDRESELRTMDNKVTGEVLITPKETSSSLFHQHQHQHHHQHHHQQQHHNHPAAATTTTTAIALKFHLKHEKRKQSR
jgi:hypothetical protein